MRPAPIRMTHCPLGWKSFHDGLRPISIKEIRISYLRTLALAATLLTPGLAHADEITDTLKSALSAYEEGDLSYALEELEFAKQLMQAMKTADLATFLPEAPDGWTRDVSNDVSTSMAMFGGGSGAEAIYARENESFRIVIMADNPMVGALSGIVDGRILIQASGADVERMKSVLTEIDHRGLEDFGR